MNILGKFVQRLFWEVPLMLDWAVKNWPLTILFLVVMIYWAGEQRRRKKRS